MSSDEMIACLDLLAAQTNNVLEESRRLMREHETLITESNARLVELQKLKGEVLAYGFPQKLDTEEHVHIARYVDTSELFSKLASRKNGNGKR